MDYFKTAQVRTHLDRLAKYFQGAVVSESPVITRSYKEFYKNGNLKAYVTVMRINNPKKEIKVRNKDYYLYRDNHEEAMMYLELLYFSETYNDLLERFGREYANFPTLNEVPRCFNFEEFIDKMLVQLSPKDHNLREPKAYQETKPNMNDSMYVYKFKFWHMLLGGSRKRKNRLVARLEFDLRSYTESYEQYYESLRKYSRQAFDINLYNRQVSIKREKLSSQSNMIFEHYKTWGEKTYIIEYFSLSFSNTVNINKIFEEESMIFELDKTTKTLVVNLSLPKEASLPVIETFRPIRKDLASSVKYLKPKQMTQVFSEIIMSYLIYIARLLSSLDTEKKVDFIVFNLYPNKRLNAVNCSAVFSAELNKIPFVEMKENEVGESFLKLFGSVFNYSLDNPSASPYKVVKSDV